MEIGCSFSLMVWLIWIGVLFVCVICVVDVIVVGVVYGVSLLVGVCGVVYFVWGFCVCVVVDFGMIMEKGVSIDNICRN